MSAGTERPGDAAQGPGDAVQGPGDAVQAPRDAADAADPRGEAVTKRAPRIQRAVAARMLQSTTSVPQFSVRDEIDMAAVLDLRDGWDRDDPDRPSINDVVIKACALALREHPRLNGSWTGDASVSFARVNVGIAVAAPGRLLVPTIFDADTRDLGGLAREARRLVEAVRGGTVTAAEMSGATFTVSNLGMYGISDFDAIIATPQAAILAVSAVREVPVVARGAVVPGVRMGVRLTCDHRLIYGADAAAFLVTLRELLHRPDWS